MGGSSGSVCAVSLFLFGVFKETQHSKFFFFLSLSKELCCVAAVLKVRCGFWHKFELTVASHNNADEQHNSERVVMTEIWHYSVQELLIVHVCVCERESCTSCLHFSGPLRQ